jgi:integrase
MEKPGEAMAAWVVNYTDASGKRRLKTFRLKRDADTYNVKVADELLAGTHTADRASVTVAEAGAQWLEACRGRGLERSSLKRNACHVNLHINPRLGALRLSQLTAPRVRTFEDELAAAGCAPATVLGILVSLSGILSEAQERGLVAQNVVRARGKRRKRGERKRLRAGVDIPTPDEIKALIPGRWRALLMTAIFTGLRASELRGLHWADIDLKKGELHVRQRASSRATAAAPIPARSRCSRRYRVNNYKLY